MTNKFSILLLAIAYLIPSISSSAQEKLPMDSKVVTGKLDNGLTYYIYNNNWPENKVDFFIAQRVGSIQEEENQRGLAHFLEHMCFNGTKHFPGNSIISYLESVGVKFGANLNAYTSTDETVYNICNVPSNRKTVLDSCFIILGDWSNGLLLKDKDIDNERGVIKGEWRFRSGAANRMLEKCAPIIYSGSRYGERLPIGLMSVVDNFKYKELRDYYKKWYHPENQAIVVVGDIDPKYAEQKIIETFSKIKMPKNAGKVISYPVPDNEELICTVQKDKEQSTTSIQLFYKHPVLETQYKNTTEELRRDYLKYLIGRMLSSRFADIAQEKDSPFVGVRVADSKFIISGTSDALILRATPKQGKEAQTIEWLENGVRRAVEYGFTEPEMVRAKRNYSSLVEDLYNNRNKQTNTFFAKSIVDSYLNGSSNLAIEDYYDYMNKIMNNTTLDDVNNYIRSIVNIPSNKNTVIVAYCPDKEGIVIPTEQELSQAYNNAKSTKLTAYVDSLEQRAILPNAPKPGSVVKEEYISSFDAKIWTLSNGAKVILKKTDFKNNEIIVTANASGGYSILDLSKIGDIKLLNDAIASSGFGDFSSSELRKALEGKKAKVTLQLTNTETKMSSSTSPSDLETALKVIHLKFTSLTKDEKAFNSLIEQNRVRLAKTGTSPRMEMGDSIHSIIYNRHPLGAKLNLTMLNDVNHDEIINMYRQAYGNASNFTFIIDGNYDETKLRNLVEQYIASLPSQEEKYQAKDINYGFLKGQNHFEWERPMESPQTINYSFRHIDCDYNLDNVINANVFGQLIKMILLQEIREKRSWTYSIQTHCNVVAKVNEGSPSQLMFPIYTIVKPGTGEETYKIIKEEINKIATQGPDRKMFQKVKEHLLKSSNDDMNDNNYWQSVLKVYDTYGKDMHTDWITKVEALTPNDIRDFTKKYIIPADYCEIMMNADKASIENEENEE